MKIRYALVLAAHSRGLLPFPHASCGSVHRHAGFSIAGSEGPRTCGLRSGQELTGTVRIGDSKLVHLGSLADGNSLTR